jgi:hypothetical protein
VCRDNEKSVLVQVKNHLPVVCREFPKRSVSLFNSGRIIKDFLFSCCSSMRGHAGTELQVGGGRELHRWWRSERWGDGGGHRIGAMVEIRGMGGCRNQRDGAMVEVREMGRYWR